MAEVSGGIGFSKRASVRPRPLAGAGRAERVKTRHLGFLFDLARLGEPELMGPRQASWLKQLHLEHDNLRAALDWCMSPAQAPEQGDRALDFATALWWFWLKRGFLAEGRQWLERAVHVAPVSSPSRGAKASNALANMAYFQGDFAGMATYATNSVALGREAGDLFSVAFGLGLQTIAAAESGDVGLALRLAGDCRAAAIASGNPWTAGPALYVLGFMAISQGDYDEASRISRRRGTSAFATRGPRAFMCLASSGFGSSKGVLRRPPRWEPKVSPCVGVSRILSERPGP